jgi:hypothetical protein
MNPWKVSAQFAAFVWYTSRKVAKPVSQTEAARFAKENWVGFLPCAHVGRGKLLIRIARARRLNGPRHERFSDQETNRRRKAG